MSTHTDETPTDSPPATDGTYTVPPDDDALVCSYCGVPFADETARALHWGLEHPDSLTDDQRDAADAALEDESQALRLFRLKVLGVLVLLYFGLMMTYAVFT